MRKVLPDWMMETRARNAGYEFFQRGKWLRNCLSCARLYECGAEKALLIWQENKCINMEDKKL